MNSYQGCENVQHCHWDMWTDCIIIQAEGLQCVFVCVLSRKIWSTLLFVLYKMQLRSWFWIVKYVVHGDYSNKHKLGRGFVVMVRNVVPNSYDLFSSVVLKKNKQQHKLKIFCFMRNAWMRFESYHGNFGLFLTQSLWRLGFFSPLCSTEERSYRFWKTRVWENNDRIFIVELSQLWVFLGSLKWQLGPYFLEGLRRDWIVFNLPKLQ